VKVIQEEMMVETQVETQIETRLDGTFHYRLTGLETEITSHIVQQVNSVSLQLVKMKEEQACLIILEREQLLDIVKI
jgi:hypothetical protein